MYDPATHVYCRGHRLGWRGRGAEEVAQRSHWCSKSGKLVSSASVWRSPCLRLYRVRCGWRRLTISRTATTRTHILRRSVGRREGATTVRRSRGGRLRIRNRRSVIIYWGCSCVFEESLVPRPVLGGGAGPRRWGLSSELGPVLGGGALPNTCECLQSSRFCSQSRRWPPVLPTPSRWRLRLAFTSPPPPLTSRIGVASSRLRHAWTTSGSIS